MSAPTFKQLEKRKTREADMEGVLEVLARLSAAVVALGRATLEEVDDKLGDVRNECEILETEITEYVDLAQYEPDYQGLAEGVGRLIDAVRLGLHDEPKSVPEFALALDDLLRDTDAV